MTQAKQIRDDTRALVREGKAAMIHWSYWVAGARERGWPDTDSLERAANAAKTAPKLQSVGRPRVRRDNAPQCRETRQTPPPRIPLDLDRDTYALMVNRLLMDMEAEGCATRADLMRFDITTSMAVHARAHEVGIGVREYREAVNRAYDALGTSLRLLDRARRVEAVRLTEITERRA